MYEYKEFKLNPMQNFQDELNKFVKENNIMKHFVVGYDVVRNGDALTFGDSVTRYVLVRYESERE